MIRWATPKDAEALGRIFYAAVREGPSPYTEAQRAAWLPEPPSGKDWAARILPLQIAVGEVAGAPVGFMSVETGGYIDLAFIHPAHHGTGLFRRLYTTIEAWAQAQGEPRLWTHASLMAQPAFQAMGFLVNHHETVERGGQNLTRAQMEKTLT